MDEARDRLAALMNVDSDELSFGLDNRTPMSWRRLLQKPCLQAMW